MSKRAGGNWKPVTPNALFTSGPNYQLNACVGERNGGPWDLAAYGRGFFSGGQLIVAGCIGCTDGSASVDTIVYPAAFVFRHGIELYLKHLLKQLRVLNDSDLDAKRRPDHFIADLFASVKGELLKVNPPVVDPSEIPMVQEFIGDFAKIDPTGQAFRYPEDISNNTHLTGLTVINVEVLADYMDTLQRVLEGWICSVDSRVSYTLEAASR